MDEKKLAVDGTQAAAPGTTATTPAVAETDVEAKIKALEIERDNYKQGLLKEKAKNKAGNQAIEDESEDERIERIVQAKLSEKKLADIDAEEKALVQKALRENKELKLALANKGAGPSAAVGAHSESAPVRDTLITPEQMAFFKSKNWSDKDIERYKKSVLKGR